MIESFQQFLNAESNQVIVLFLIIAIGVLFGRVEVKGVSLGSSGVLFSAILFGHFGATLPSFISTVGVVLFVYATGLQAGPRFFKTFRSAGLNFAFLAIATLIIGVLTAAAADAIFEFDTGMAAGLYTGALTTTPGLAAAIESVQDQDPTGTWASNVSVGYGIAYPFGVAGVVLFVQVFPRLMRLDLKGLASKEAVSVAQSAPKGMWYEVKNPQLIGQTVGELTDQHIAEATITRVRHHDGTMSIAENDQVIAKGDQLWIVARPSEMRVLSTVIGPHVSDESPMKEREEGVLVRDIFVTEDKIAGRKLQSLDVRGTYGVVISRLWREEIEFVPNPDMSLAIGDTIRVVGSTENVERFIAAAGNVEKKLQETNFLPLSGGICLGAWLGSQPFSLPGTSFTMKLGMAGGPLFVALLAGHFGRIGNMTIRVPIATKIFIRELGLMFFLAGAGVAAGGSFWEAFREYGVSLFLAGAAITLLPMVAAWILARKVFKLDILPALGAICGGMTSTPALGALTTASDSETPALAYATVYPVALIVVTILAQLLGKYLFMSAGG